MINPLKFVSLVALVVSIVLLVGSSVVASAWPAHATVPINEELVSVLEQADVMTASQPVTKTLSSGTAVEQKAYSIVVHGAEQNFVPADSPMRATDGHKWVLVLAGLNNFQSALVTVTQESLVLIDQAGTRYLPDPPDGQTQPALVGKTVVTGQRTLGLVRFDVPSEVTGEWLEWCPTSPVADCAEPARSPVPLTPTVGG